MVINSTNKKTKQSPFILTEHQKNMPYDLGNPGPGLEQAQKCGWVKPVNGNPILLS
jgi:hypothetical protein